MTTRIITGDALAVLPTLDEKSVQCCVSSPPYWGLRDYNAEGQLGLEATPEEYIANQVAVFRLVARALRDDGTLWLNMGDSYTDAGRGADVGSTLEGTRRNQRESRRARAREKVRPFGLASKQLIGMPWRLAFALQADGWILRSDIVWQKPNPMPESVRDRPTKAHEYVFLFSKKPRYYYNAAAIMEAVTGNAHARCSGVGPKDRIPSGWATDTEDRADTELRGRYSAERKTRPQSRARGKNEDSGDPRKDGFNDRWNVKQNESFQAAVRGLVAQRNRRSVWTIPTAPFRGAHFATFPPALAEPCILAGSRPGDLVLDPFLGAGTTALVADRLGRSCVGIELSSAYAEMALRRLEKDSPMFADVALDACDKTGTDQ